MRLSISDIGVLRVLAKRARWHLENQIGIYRAMRQAPGVEIRQGVTIINPHLFECGENMRIESGCFIHCGGNSWSQGRGKIRFGKNCRLSQNNVLYGAGEIEAGDCVGTGPGVFMFSSRADYSVSCARVPGVVHKFGKITIGSYARIFAGAIIGPGVNIGEGAIICAGAVVLKDVPAWSMVAGVPARVLRHRGEDHGRNASVTDLDSCGRDSPSV